MDINSSVSDDDDELVDDEEENAEKDKNTTVKVETAKEQLGQFKTDQKILINSLCLISMPSKRVAISNICLFQARCYY